MVSTSNYSKEEIDFFQNLLFNEIRPDGRTKYQNKKITIIEKVLPSTVFSLELKNKETKIYFSLKADLSKTYQGISVTCDSISYKSVFSNNQSALIRDSSLPSVNEVQEVLYILDKLILSKIEKERLTVINSDSIKNENCGNGNDTVSIDNNLSPYYWNISINIFSLEKIHIHNLQTIAFGVNYLLNNAMLPKVRIFKHVLTEIIDYDIIPYQYQKLELNLGRLVILGSYNGNLFMDPSLEEVCIIDALVLIVLNDSNNSSNSNDIRYKITHFETYGFLVDIANLDSLEKFISNVDLNNKASDRIKIILNNNERSINDEAIMDNDHFHNNGSIEGLLGSIDINKCVELDDKEKEQVEDDN